MPAGLILGVVQLLFALTWTVYVIFLPAVAESAGIPRRWVIWILVADQAIFIVMDFALGVAADRVASGLRRLGPSIAAVNAVSCAAFVAIPFVAASGNAASAALLAAILVWSATSSALRAPVFALLAKRAQPAQSTWLANLALLGLGLAGAIAPLMTAKLRGADPRLPFVLAGLGLLAATAALAWCERRIAAAGSPAPHAQASRPVPGMHFFIAVALLCVGFQVHTAINSAPAYLRFAPPSMLDVLMPAFWVGFNLLILPVAWLANRSSAPTVLAIGAVAGTASLALMGFAPNLMLLTGLQVAAGAGWALIIGGAVNAALDGGRSGREGRFSGAVFALLALGALLRLLFVAVELHKAPELLPVLRWLPALAWSAAALLCLLWLARAGGSPRAGARA